MAGELWLAGYFKGYFVGRSVREVCAGSEDILLSERDGGVERPCGLREEKRARAGSRNGIQESLGFNKNIKKSGPLIIGVRGLDSSSFSSYSRFYSSLIYILLI
jgi:hypothetical protein